MHKQQNQLCTVKRGMDFFEAIQNPNPRNIQTAQQIITLIKSYKIGEKRTHQEIGNLILSKHKDLVEKIYPKKISNTAAILGIKQVIYKNINAQVRKNIQLYNMKRRLGEEGYFIRNEFEKGILTKMSKNKTYRNNTILQRGILIKDYQKLFPNATERSTSKMIDQLDLAYGVVWNIHPEYDLRLENILTKYDTQEIANTYMKYKRGKHSLNYEKLYFAFYTKFPDCTIKKSKIARRVEKIRKKITQSNTSTTSPSPTSSPPRKDPQE